MSVPVSFPPRSRALDSLPAYAVARLAERRRELELAGRDIIDLGAGDADLAPPPRAVEGLREAILDPRYSRYGFQLGLIGFREAVAAWMERRFGLDVDPLRELLPLIGSKEGIAHLFQALLNPGDVAILPDPGYPAYLGGTVLAGGEPCLVPLRPETDFLLPLEAVAPEMEARARVLVLNYPNNPTTAVAPREYLEKAVAYCRERGIVLVHDLAYSEVAFDGYRPPSILEIPGARDVALEFHSLSKTYNMTGWRLGWAAGGPELVGLLSRVKTFLDTGPPLAIQAGGIGALESWESWVPENVAVFQRRRDAAVVAFREAGFQAEPPRATMYMWIPVPPEMDAEAFGRRALEEAGVAVLPGTALGAGGEGFFRVALTVSEERLREAAGRLAAVSNGA